ncbi:MAG: T9SS type A sorting domain-containing protein [Candidatus Kapaibacterium sp.]
MKKLHRILLALALVASSSLVAQAQCHGNDKAECKKECSAQPGEMMKKFQPLMHEMKAWVKQDVVPVLRTWKQQFDAKLESGDLTTLNSLRSRARELQKQSMDLMKRSHEARMNKDEAAGEQLRTEWKAMFEKREQLMRELKPLAEKNKEALKQLGETAKPQVQQWMQTAKDKAETFMKNNNIEERGMMRHAMPMMMGFGKEMGFGGHNPKKMAARFMLWDGGDIPELDGNQFMPESMPRINTVTGSDNALSLDQNYPNPVTIDKTSITFTLPQSERVSLLLVDANGRTVATIADGMYSAGKNTVDFNTSALANGAYVYKLTTPSGTVSKTMTVSK